VLWMYTVTGQHKDHSSLCTLTKFGAFTQYDSAFFDGSFLPLDGLSEKKKNEKHSLSVVRGSGVVGLKCF